MSAAAAGVPGAARARARLLLLGSALAFGLMAVLARLLGRGGASGGAAGGGAAFTAGQLAVIRFAAGAAFSLAAFRLKPGLYAPANRRLLWSRGISGGVVVVLYFLALARLPAGEAGLLYNLFPVIATALAIPLFGERPTVHLGLGLLTATAGVAILLLGGGLAPAGGAAPGAGGGVRAVAGSAAGGLVGAAGLGEALAVGAAVFAAISAVTIRAMRQSDNAATIFFYFCLGGLPVALPFALDPWPLAAGPWGLALLMAAAAWAAQVFMAEAYGALTVGEAAVWLQLTPVAQALLAVPILGERFTGWSAVGVLLGVAGVAWGSAKGSRRG